MSVPRGERVTHSRRERQHVQASMWGAMMSVTHQAKVTLDDGTKWIVQPLFGQSELWRWTLIEAPTARKE